ncbi:cytochrome b6f complex subunit (petM) [Thalictrum thalictroides]|uniref:Cytochrome b6f complex subunit (PetM) n=1 Tax=Thalictrum thalictroides TaxID=46969 RepID=A0A7J6W1Z6_THATH|nr:cytochrome b6f complex subunit (petM) [Thalictrum thalictroides]
MLQNCKFLIKVSSSLKGECRTAKKKKVMNKGKTIADRFLDCTVSTRPMLKVVPFESNYHFFTIKLCPTYVHDGLLQIPSYFIRNHLPKTESSVSIVDSKGRRWSMMYHLNSQVCDELYVLELCLVLVAIVLNSALQSALCTTKKIPTAFINSFNGVLPEKIMLKYSVGRVWHVEVKRVENDFFFQKGWQEFVKMHSLVMGEFLVFRYDGNSTFKVKLYDHSGCEKEETLDDKNINKAVCFIKEEDNKEASKPITKPILAICDSKHKHSKGLKKIDKSGCRYTQPERVSVKYVQKNVVSKASETDQPKPHFDVVVNPKARYSVHIPKQVLTDNNIKIQPKIFLRDPTGKSWPATVRFSKDGRTRITGGWFDFCRANNLKEKDECEFKFAQRRSRGKFIIDVHIRRPKHRGRRGFNVAYLIQTLIPVNQNKKREEKIRLPYPCHTPIFFALPQLNTQNSSTPSQKIGSWIKMATTSATLSTATLTKATSVSSTCRNSSQTKRNVVHVGGLNSFGGLKAYNKVASLGLPLCTEQSFAKVVSSLKTTSQGRGGALTSTCNAGAEIFRIVLVINGLTLIGVAVGFVLLRIEAFVEEAAEAE